jgi:hypothetical protein
MAVTIGQAGFRLRNDDGNETTATWKGNQNVNVAQAVDTNFRVRFLMQNSGSTASNNLVAQLEYTLNGGASTNVSASSTVVRSSASPNVTDAANITQQLTGGTGTFIGLTGYDEVDGAAGGASLDVPASGNFEVEYSIQIRSADTVPGDVIGLRVTNSGTDFTGTYSQTPAIIRLPQPLVPSVSDALGSYADSLGAFFVLNANPTTDALGSYADSLGVTRGVNTTPLTASFTDALGSYADSLVAQLRRLGWQDTQSKVLLAYLANVGPDALSQADALAAFQDYLANPTADNLNAWADSVGITLTIGTTPITASFTDALGSYADALSALEAYLVAPSADSLGTYADSLANIIGLLLNPTTDALGSYADSVNRILGLLITPTTDDLGGYADSIVNILGILIKLTADGLGSYADVLAAQLNYLANPATDALGSYSDSLVALQAYLVNPTADNLNAWADSAGKVITGQAAIDVALSDNLGTYADALAGFEAYLANPNTDVLGSYSDSLADIISILVSPTADNLAAYADSLDGRFAYLARASDNLAQYSDSVITDGTGVVPPTGGNLMPWLRRRRR